MDKHNRLKISGRYACIGAAAAFFLMSACTLVWADLVPPDDVNIQYWGRVDKSDPVNVKFSWTRVMIVTVFEGTSLGMIMEDSLGNYDIEIDGSVKKTIVTESGKTEYELASGLAAGEHLLRIIKRNEHTIETIINDLSYRYSHATFSGLVLDDGCMLKMPPAKPTRRIEFIGDAYTVAMGVESSSTTCTAGERRGLTNSNKSFAVMVADACQAEPMVLGITAHGAVHNWGDMDQSSATPMKYFYTRVLFDNDVMWNFSSWVPHVVVIQLGDSDFSEFQIIDYGAPLANPSEFKEGIQYFIDMAFENYPNLAAVLFVADTKEIVGPTYEYTEQVVKANSDRPVHIIPFPAIEYTGCDFHADEVNQKIIADSVLEKLNKIVDWENIVDAEKQSEPYTKQNRHMNNRRMIYPNISAAAADLQRFSRVDIYSLNGSRAAVFAGNSKPDIATLSVLSGGVYVIRAFEGAEKAECRFLAGW